MGDEQNLNLGDDTRDVGRFEEPEVEGHGVRFGPEETADAARDADGSEAEGRAYMGPDIATGGEG